MSAAGVKLPPKHPRILGLGVLAQIWLLPVGMGHGRRENWQFVGSCSAGGVTGEVSGLLRHLFLEGGKKASG